MRELENTIARACALNSTDLLLPEDIPFTKKAFCDDSKVKDAVESLLTLAPENGTNVIEWASSLLVQCAIDNNKNDLNKAARELGLSLLDLEALQVK